MAQRSEYYFSKGGTNPMSKIGYTKTILKTDQNNPVVKEYVSAVKKRNDKEKAQMEAEQDALAGEAEARAMEEAEGEYQAQQEAEAQAEYEQGGYEGD